MAGAILAPNLNVSRRLFSLAANMNVTTDQPLVADFPIATYIIDRVEVYGASVSMTTAAGGIYDGAGKTGNTLVAASQAYAALTTPAKTLAATLASTDVRSLPPILALTTAQGAAATATFEVWGQAKS